MKALLRWLAKIVGSAVTVVLVIVLFPYLSKLAARLMPDESGAAIKASAILASRMEQSARLETMRVEDEGVLNYDIQAAFVGSVANINVRYRYCGSFGIDLTKVEMAINGNELVMYLPQPELIQDSLTPLETYRDDFWYPGFSDDDYNKLLENEKKAHSASYLTGEHAEKLQNATLETFQTTIASWLVGVNDALTLRYELVAEDAATE